MSWQIPVMLLALAASAAAQTPQPFPRPSSSSPGTQTQPPPARQAPAQPATRPPSPAPAAGEPTEAMLGVPLYPAAQFIASYDAGRGQRYYIYGSGVPYAEMVTYYRNTLRDRGSVVFDEPPTHMFEVGRFRDESMAFPPGVTVKDFTWGGSKGYPNPKRPADPERFPTIIMIVPPPSAASGR